VEPVSGNRQKRYQEKLLDTEGAHERLEECDRKRVFYGHDHSGTCRCPKE